MFKTFPEFSKLTLADKKLYDTYAKKYPPIADLSFASLMTWWNSFDSMALAELNGNLVIPYWFPGNEAHSGLGLVGAHKVDESICTIFDYLRARGEPVRLMNVPEFVVSNVQYPELFNFKEERAYHEYVFDLANWYPPQDNNGFRARKIKRQLQKLGDGATAVKAIDLRSEDNQKMLLDAANRSWAANLNNVGRHEEETMIPLILHARALGVKNVCLFINGKLRGFCLYQRPHDRSYIIINVLKVLSKDLRSFELAGFLFAKWLAEHDSGVRQVNINSDMGVLPLRMFTLTLGPVNFFRKYRIEPA